MKLTTPRVVAITIISVVLVVAVGGAYVSHSVWSVVAEHQTRNEAAKPLFDAVVTSKLKTGDSLEVVKKTLDYAGLRYSEDTIRRMLFSTYPTGEGSCIALAVAFDPQGRISEITVQPQTTGM